MPSFLAHFERAARDESTCAPDTRESLDSTDRSVAQLAAYPALTRDCEGSIPSGPTAASRRKHVSRRSHGDVRLRHASLRDRLAGRTLASEPRKTGSNPVPGTAWTLFTEARPPPNGPRSMTTWRQGSTRTRVLTASPFRLERARTWRVGSSSHVRVERVFPAKPNGQAAVC